nr:hypothetical protein [Tanacetum cinerariifolium]
MTYEHPSTTPKTKSNKVIESSAKNLVQILSEYEVTSDDENFDLEEEIRLVENLLYDNSSPRPPEELNVEIANTINKTLPTSPIPVEDSDSFREEIDIFTGTDDLLPPGIESDDYDSEGDIHFIEELLRNDSISLLENESSYFDHHDDPSFPRPPPESLDVEFFFDFEPNSEELISAAMNNINDLNEDECFDLGETTDLDGSLPLSRYGFSKNHQEMAKTGKTEHEIEKIAQKPDPKIFSMGSKIAQQIREINTKMFVIKAQVWVCTDCHPGNPCDPISHLTAKIRIQEKDPEDLAAIKGALVLAQRELASSRSRIR